MNKISIEEILHKHGVLGGCIHEATEAIKEIVEAVVDKQVKYIDESLIPLLEAMERQKIIDRKVDDWENREIVFHPTQIGAMVALERTKDSILNVKNMISYE